VPRAGIPSFCAGSPRTPVRKSLAPAGLLGGRHGSTPLPTARTWSRNERASFLMTIPILLLRRVRRKLCDHFRARFLSTRSALVARSERAKMPHVRHAACPKSSHNLSHLKPFQMRPLRWSISWPNAYASRCEAAHRMREKPSALGSGLDSAAVPKRPRQPSRGRRAGDSCGARGLTRALVKHARRRARAATPDRDDVGNRRTRARAASRARRSSSAAPARRVSALRLAGASVERTVSPVREGARCR
jgi:hypothetical protein